MRRIIKNFAKSTCDRLINKAVPYLRYNGELSRDVVPNICHNRALADSADYADTHMTTALMFTRKQALWDYAWSQVGLDGLFAEFGVFQGYSINYFAKKTEKILYGFDSFEGLQEDWAGHNMPKGSFDLGGNLPTVRPNVRLIKGWFDTTVPVFLQEHQEPLAFLHVDSDTYEAAKFLFEALSPRLLPGTVILFDEYFGYRGWRIGEWKAWQEYVKSTGTRYRYLGFSSEQVAIILE